MSNKYAVGQAWTYPTPDGFEDSRIVVGAVEDIEGQEPIICISVTDAPVPRPGGLVATATISFMPFSKPAIDATVDHLDGDTEIPAGFSEGYDGWKNDPDGMGFFNIPFPTLLAQIFQEMSDTDEPIQ